MQGFNRSGHDATVVAHDTPHHHDVRVVTELGLSQSSTDEIVQSWAQDLQGDRQSPVRNPGVCYCVIQTPDGPVALQHHALAFGSTGSVWCFNRAADGIMFAARRLLAVPACHYMILHGRIRGHRTQRCGRDQLPAGQQDVAGIGPTKERVQSITSFGNTESINWVRA